MRYKCSNCGNIVEHKPKFCPKCGYCVLDTTDISFGFDVDGSIIPLRVAFVNEKELKIANLIASKLDNVEVAHRTDAYTSILFKDVNVARVEWVNGGIRLHIIMTKENKKKYIDHPMFAIHKNKNQVLWTTKYDDSQLPLYLELIKDGIDNLEG